MSNGNISMIIVMKIPNGSFRSGSPMTLSKHCSLVDHLVGSVMQCRGHFFCRYNLQLLPPPPLTAVKKTFKIIMWCRSKHRVVVPD